MRESSGEYLSDRGSPLLSLSLTDATGESLDVTLTGRHASVDVAEGDEVVLAFGLLKAGRADAPATMWIYDEGYVMKV